MKQYSVKQYNTINTIQYEAMLYEAIQNTEKCKCSSDTLYYEQSDAQDMHDESSRPLSLQTATAATKPTIGSPCTTFTAHMAVYVNRNVDWRAIECSQPSPACHPLPMNLGHNRSFLTSKMPPLYQTTKFCSARGCSPSRKLFHQCAAAAHHLAVPLSDAQEQVGATQDGHRGVAHPTGSAQGEGCMAAAAPDSEVGERPAIESVHGKRDRLVLTGSFL